jgi:hypothetical protein
VILEKMSPSVHVIQSLLGTAALYPFIGIKAIIFGVSIIAIDLDHFVEYYRDTGKLGVGGLFEYHRTLVNNLDNFLGLNLLHTIECYLVLLFVGLYIQEAHLVLMGFLFHHFFDQIQLSIMKRPFARAFSVIEYLIRRKYYFTSIHDILRNKGEIEKHERQGSR